MYRGKQMKAWNLVPLEPCSASQRPVLKPARVLLTSARLGFSRQKLSTGRQSHKKHVQSPAHPPAPVQVWNRTRGDLAVGLRGLESNICRSSNSLSWDTWEKRSRLSHSPSIFLDYWKRGRVLFKQMKYSLIQEVACREWKVSFLKNVYKWR